MQPISVIIPTILREKLIRNDFIPQQIPHIGFGIASRKSIPERSRKLYDNEINIPDVVLEIEAFQITEVPVICRTSVLWVVLIEPVLVSS